MENENINISLSEITAESISQQAERWRKAHADASAAAGAYMADLKQRKAELSKLEAGYKSQLKNLNAQRKVLAARVTDLSSRGEIDKAAEEDERLEATDKAISTLERKLRLVSETELKGDPRLYEAAKAAYEAVGPAKDTCVEDLRATADTLEEEIQRLKQLQDNAYNIINGEMRYPGDIGFNKVERHFRELDRLEREAHERAKAKAAAEARKGVVQVVIPPKA